MVAPKERPDRSDRDAERDMGEIHRRLPRVRMRGRSARRREKMLGRDMKGIGRQKQGELAGLGGRRTDGDCVRALVVDGLVGGKKLRQMDQELPPLGINTHNILAETCPPGISSPQKYSGGELGLVHQRFIFL
jgi:hypothetical protein